MKTISDPKLGGLGSYLVAKGYLDGNTIERAQKEASHKRIPFTTYLGQQHFLDYRTIAETTADYFGLPYIDLNDYDLASLPLEILSIELIQKYFALPILKNTQQLTLAVTDPALVDLNKINFITNLRASFIIVEIDKLTKAIDRIYSQQLHTSLEIQEKDLEIIKISPQDIEKNSVSLKSEKSPVVKLLNKVLLDAIDKHASDIHFEPYENFYRIRFRIDGILYEFSRQPINLANFLTARLKVMANLDISERKIPQDGQFKISFSKYRIINFRLNTCPTEYGEKAVVRILEPTSDLLDIYTLGMNEQQQQLFTAALSYSQGLILVTGPTGSGKTVTLYTALNRLNTSEINICSVEDPIEMNLPGINQVQVNPKFDLKFSTILRAFLRQDPDIIMVGEIRDLETAEIAIRAAQTGHLVLSTLHTNSASETLARLSDMGIPTFNITSSIILIIAQRLVRRLCNICKHPSPISSASLLLEGFLPEELHNFVVYKAQGCMACNQGYQGRIGIYEVLPRSNDLTAMIIKNARSRQLAAFSKHKNISNLRRSGLNKVKAGLTSVEEINRVIKE